MTTYTGNSSNNTWFGTSSADTYIGNGGEDTVVYLTDQSNDGTYAGVTINLKADGVGGTGSGGQAEGDLFYGIEDVVGTTLNDKMQGSDSDNFLKGAGGADYLKGGGGNDILYSSDSNFTNDNAVDSLFGGSGDDAYYVDSTEDIVNEASGSGTDTVYAMFSYNLGNTNSIKGNVENLTLSGTGAINGTGNELDNRIQGSEADNMLQGLGGNDTLVGGSGNDTMQGGAGNDTYYIDDIGDIVDESVTGSTGIDTVISSLSIALANTSRIFGEVENLTLAGTGNLSGQGNALDNAITGNTGANLLSGLGGNDVLDGGAGGDTLQGGAGNDTYIVDSTADVVDETIAGSGGRDTVQSYITFDLATQPSRGAGVIENLTLIGNGATNGSGNNLSNVMIGNSGANTLYGRGGNDTLDGGLGSDILVGGTGNDKYYVDTAFDVVVEQANEGSDTVYATTSFTLDADVYIETLSVRDIAGTAAINLTGNAFAQTVIGNAGSNTLTAGGGNDTVQGGGGSDLLYGGTGDDTYVVSDVAALVFEKSGEGSDTVTASVSYTLAAGQSVETLRTLSDAGTQAINFEGNELVNKLVGNNGANVLDGGAGADLLYGKGGNDTFVISEAGDKVYETAGQGSDTVQTTVSYVLAAGQSIETLRTTNDAGTASINLSGNELANKLVGNAGANILTGGGGSDSLYGKGGADTFVFNSLTDSTVSASGRDTIQDFSRVQGDRIDLHLIDAVAGGVVNQAFKFIGADAFNDRAGELRASTQDGDTLISGDVNGDGAADFSVLLKGALTLHSGDFIL